MYLENPTVTDTVNELAAVSCKELFADYGVALARGRHDWNASDQPVLSSVMGFVGERLRGTCLLACEPGPLDTSCPPGGFARDWIGELANQLVGRLKVKLLAYDVNVALTTPIILQGVRIQPLPRKRTVDSITFAGSHGAVLVWLEVEVEAGFVLPEPRPANAGETGELLLF